MKKAWSQFNNLSIQVLSNTVADTFASRNLQYTAGTEEFIRLTDQFFDCLNVATTYEGKKKNKATLFPYEDPNDWRLKVSLCLFPKFRFCMLLHETLKLFTRFKCQIKICIFFFFFVADIYYIWAQLKIINFLDRTNDIVALPQEPGEYIAFHVVFEFPFF